MLIARRSKVAGPGHAPRLRSAAALANAPLDCLAGGALASRFHVWQGRSGRRYVCSVFPVRDGDERSGLPDFDDAIVIGVRVDGPGRRSLAAVFELGRTDGRVEQLCPRLEAEVSEWHVHLLARDPGERQCAIQDLRQA